ncbi:hypothetical protein BDK51DRAFT_45142 [Blyttiomyces helicus]|uniref:Cullin family profile domain-containing protein n=1 Tax=Blyttiomyces helicus TaxID=388810 RepID=A0A4V1IQS4_9FUNG|nr:hypothetical protein BDK51DRAFT_45142 [Blyttiomyces helicus]|eukprot:RKO87567.1 hypothetical protein BDK51DRAFT_45142 [Blyttiomyces helicus]
MQTFDSAIHDGEDWDNKNWMPDSIDTYGSLADRKADVFTHMFSIFEERKEYVVGIHNLIMERLLAKMDFDTVSEGVSTVGASFSPPGTFPPTPQQTALLEILKTKLGETALSKCDVMIKDIGVSRRDNTLIRSTLVAEDPFSKPCVQALVLSRLYWPNLSEKRLTLPSEIEKELVAYNAAYMLRKGKQVLRWLPAAGTVELELQLEDRVRSFAVSPTEATLIIHFGDRGTWTFAELEEIMGTDSGSVRKALNVWIGHGIIKEMGPDTFLLLEVEEREQDATGDVHTTPDFEEGEDSPAGEVSEQMHAVLWGFIRNMLGQQPMTAPEMYARLAPFKSAFSLEDVDLDMVQRFLKNKHLEGVCELDRSDHYSLVEEKDD